MAGRKAETYRAARRNRARAEHIIWREITVPYDRRISPFEHRRGKNSSFKHYDHQHHHQRANLRNLKKKVGKTWTI